MFGGIFKGNLAGALDFCGEELCLGNSRQNGTADGREWTQMDKTGPPVDANKRGWTGADADRHERVGMHGWDANSLE